MDFPRLLFFSHCRFFFFFCCRYLLEYSGWIFLSADRSFVRMSSVVITCLCSWGGGRKSCRHFKSRGTLFKINVSISICCLSWRCSCCFPLKRIFINWVCASFCTCENSSWNWEDINVGRLSLLETTSDGITCLFSNFLPRLGMISFSSSNNLFTCRL